MRFADALVEAARNVRLGVARAGVLLLVVALTAIGSAWLDGTVISGTLSKAEQFRAAGADVWVLALDDGIDASRCAGLASRSEVVASGALRTLSAGTRFSVLPSLAVDSFEATADWAKAVGISAAGSGDLFVSDRLAADLGAERLGWTSTVEGRSLFIRGSFAYPADGRSPLLEYATVGIVPPGTEAFDACWFRIWPADSQLASSLREVPLRDAAVVADANFRQLNSTFGTDLDPVAEFAQRTTGGVGLAAGAVALLATLVVGMLRRLEYASARHIGIGRRTSALIACLEFVLWATPLALIIWAAALVLGVLLNPAEPVPVVECTLRIGAVATAGALLGNLAMPLLVSERRLIEYFKSR